MTCTQFLQTQKNGLKTALPSYQILILGCDTVQSHSSSWTFLRNECTASIFVIEELAWQETCKQKVAWSHFLLSGYMFKYHFHLEDGSSTLLPTVNFFWLHSVTSQKIVIFLASPARTPKPTKCNIFFCFDILNRKQHFERWVLHTILWHGISTQNETSHTIYDNVCT
jgi:hypothetical protein